MSQTPTGTRSSSAQVWEIALYEPAPAGVYPIDAAAELLGLSRRMIVLCCKHGLVHQVGDPRTEGWHFTGEALRTLRRVGQVRALCPGSLMAIRKILELQAEVERLKSELRALR